MTTVQANAPSPAVLDAMNPQKGSGRKSVAEEAQDRFMTLLVTQMKNQDPLNPLDNAQVTSQLAQLSTVTGIDKLNDSLAALMGSYQSSQSLQAANLIGHGVLVPGNSLHLVEGQGVMGVELAEPVDKMTVTVYDSSGKEVRKLELGAQQPGVIPVAWDGKNADGADMDGGMYSFKVDAMRGNDKVSPGALQLGMVSSVATNAQGVKITLPGMGEFNFADVRQIL